MSLSRIKAIIMQELYITKHSMEVIVDLFYFSVITVIAWGFISIYLTGDSNSLAGHYLLIGMILWEIIRIIQYSISVGALWNIWSRNLSNMFITPLSLAEYMTAQLISGIIKAFVLFLIISVISAFLFEFNIFQLGIINLMIYFINLTIFAWTAGLIILAFIFRYGTRIQALAWGLIFIFQPLTAVFFPVKVLPVLLQKISYFIPATHIFEAARGNLLDSSTNWNLINLAFLENIVYLVVSLWFFNFMFNRSKETGQFSRNEG